jgi:hypothetical protein
MRFHLVSLPHTNTTDAFSSCAYTEKVRKFAIMMMNLGHEVFLYAGEQNEAPCTEHIICIDEELRAKACDGKHYTQAPFNAQLPHWVIFNSNVIKGIITRAQKQDFICINGGHANKMIADALPHLACVEFGVGYSGTFAKYRVWESYAWMHMCYGAQAREPSNADGIWFDAVIPGYIEMDRFPFGDFDDREDYFLYLGRIIDRKGWKIAEEVCKHLGKRLVVAGFGDLPTYGEYAGPVGPAMRGELMRKARAVFMPTIYIEPFGNVAIEAMACGTPVISTDWGAFTETIIQGVTGYRCRSFQGFVDAARWVHMLDHGTIRRHARQNYSLEVVGYKYEAYFQKLLTLWDKGWYQLREEISEPQGPVSILRPWPASAGDEVRDGKLN